MENTTPDQTVLLSLTGEEAIRVIVALNAYSDLLRRDEENAAYNAPAVRFLKAEAELMDSLAARVEFAAL
jgi:cell division protein ZapA (FtsZ GTPase activity inhibitor)